MPTASLIKLPVMIATYEAVDKGKLSLDDMIELKKTIRCRARACSRPIFRRGEDFAPRRDSSDDLDSDNTATNLVLDKLGLPDDERVHGALGCPETQINSKVFRRDTSIAPERSKNYGLGSTTPRHGELVELLYNKSW